MPFKRNFKCKDREVKSKRREIDTAHKTLRIREVETIFYYHMQ